MPESDHLTTALVFFTLAYAGGVGLLCWWHVGSGSRAGWRPMLLAAYGSAAIGAALLGAAIPMVLALVMTSAFAAIVVRRRLPSFTHPRLLMMVCFLQLLVVGVLWGARFAATIPVSPVTRALMLAGYPLALFLLPVGLIHAYEGWEVLWRKTWRRPRRALAGKPRPSYPKVSIHVPVHAEPPDIVIATLDSLAKLKYPNVEVLVIDNNTEDERLWRPVEAHCRRLGDGYRFLHVEGLAGAKAGALNLALRHTAPDAELVSIVDADYEVDPDFLERLVGYFDDPKMGFVQAPHDYRGWEGRPYLRACYWEYRYFFRTILVSRNERDAAITVGTMCLIRRDALEEAGGWAEWCVTEDSELAIRIHALGYSSVYLSESFGRGLIPETFLGYKRQRFRWTYGPVQELKRHWRLLLPAPFAHPSELSAAQKIHHLTHGLDRVSVGTAFLLVLLGAGVMASMVAHREVVPVPLALWLVMTVLLVTGVVLRWLVYRVVMGSSMLDTLRASVASKALAHTVTIASAFGLLTRTMPWRRTNKFRAAPSAMRAFRCTRVELSLGLLSAALAILVISAQPRPGLLLMLCIGALLQSLRYFAATYLALLGERDLRTESAAVRAETGRTPARWRRPSIIGPMRWRLARVGVGVVLLAATAAGIILLARLDSYLREPNRSSLGPSAEGEPAAPPASPGRDGGRRESVAELLPLAPHVSGERRAAGASGAPGAAGTPVGDGGSGAEESGVGSGEVGDSPGVVGETGSGSGESTPGADEAGPSAGIGGGGSGGGGSTVGSGGGGSSSGLGAGGSGGGGSTVGSGGGGSTVGSGGGGGSGGSTGEAAEPALVGAQVTQAEFPAGLPTPGVADDARSRG